MSNGTDGYQSAFGTGPGATGSGSGSGRGRAADLGLYPARFHREMAPVWLSMILNARGLAAPALQGTRWCEIGCGQGIDTLILAAANPDMDFVGIDIDPRHIEAGQDMARRAGLTNARLIHADIRDPGSLPDLGAPFDFILSHGVYSWVSGDVQAAIHGFIADRLAPGGVAALHYLSQPGAAQFSALRAALAAMGPAEVSVATRLQRLVKMAEAGAGLMAEHPRMARLLTQLQSEPEEFVAHEYLTRACSLLTAGEMITRMGDQGLVYAGSTRPIENYDNVSLPARTQSLIAAEPDGILRENLRDIARNQPHRFDIYVNQPQHLDPQTRAALAGQRRFMQLRQVRAPLVFETAVGPVDGPAEIFTPILDHLARGPVDLLTLAQLPQFAGQAGAVEQALLMLVGAGIAHPMLPVQPSPGAADRLNAVLPAGGLRAVPGIGSAL